jgi:pyruvate,water dikinase
MRHTQRRSIWSLAALSIAAALSASCGPGATRVPCPAVAVTERACTITDATMAPDSLARIECMADYQALSSEPLDTSIPGARSVKVVLDRGTDGALYFQNSRKFTIHYEFASARLSGSGKPLVPSLAEFNQTEYYAPDRRFLLGAVTYYEGPKIWALEIAPYDTASAELITALHAQVAASAWFGPALAFHPTSAAVAVEAAKLSGIRVVTTDEIYQGIGYQPLNLATAMGKLRFLSAADLANTYVSYQDIVVLDNVPNDISVGQRDHHRGVPDAALAHQRAVQNRKTPNMGLKGATTNTTLRALEGSGRAHVSATAWSVREVTSSRGRGLLGGQAPRAGGAAGRGHGHARPPRHRARWWWSRPRSRCATRSRPPSRAFGGKCAHYAVLYAHRRRPHAQGLLHPGLPLRPVHGGQRPLRSRSPRCWPTRRFRTDAAVRDTQLAALRDAIEAAPSIRRCRTRCGPRSRPTSPGSRCASAAAPTARTSTGSRARAATSRTPAIRPTGSTCSTPSARPGPALAVPHLRGARYYGIDHTSVVMALLVHHNFPDEEANGVAVTANPFDPSGLQPGFYVNVQHGGDGRGRGTRRRAPPAISSSTTSRSPGSPSLPVALQPRGRGADRAEQHAAARARPGPRRPSTTALLPRVRARVRQRRAGMRWTWSSSSTATRARCPSWW